jgi:hypothetical protein
MRNKGFLMLAAALLASPAAAQPGDWHHPEDHLEPERPALSLDYDVLLHDLLHDAYDHSVDVSMVALPSFVPEYAVGLRSIKTIGTGTFQTTTRGAPYHIFVLSPEAQIWTYHSIAALKNGQERIVGDKNNEARNRQMAQLQSKVPVNPRDLKVDRCEADISDALGNRIVAVWGKMLMNVRYAARYQGGADGVTLHFNGFVAGPGRIGGVLVASQRDSATGTLVALANAMRDACEKKATEADLDKLTLELEQRMQKGQGR